MKSVLVLFVIQVVAIAQVPFAILITFDDFPNDITWELLFRANNQRIATGARGASGSLPATEYIFRISDSFGDGLCCANGQGFYSLRANSMDFFISDGQFGSSEVVEFVLTAGGQAQILNDAVPATPATAIALGEFEIELVPAADFDPTTQPGPVAVLEAAAARWATVILGDLPDINGVDDLRITYDFSLIDGPGRMISSAGPTRIRSGSLLPYLGQMTFDSDDVGRLNADQLEALFLHEIGHVLGVGTLWRNLGCSQCEQGSPQYNPTGQCPSAEEAFEKSPGHSPGVNLLIEQNSGQGPVCGHFDEVQLQSEVMTGFLTTNRETGISELSTITIGTLQDMGYSVNFDTADEFTVHTSNLNSAIILDLSHDILDEPIEVDMIDAEQEMVMDNLNDLMNQSNNTITGTVLGSLGGAIVTGLSAVYFIQRRRKRVITDGSKHLHLVESV